MRAASSFKTSYAQAHVLCLAHKHCLNVISCQHFKFRFHIKSVFEASLEKSEDPVILDLHSTWQQSLEPHCSHPFRESLYSPILQVPNVAGFFESDWRAPASPISPPRPVLQRRPTANPSALQSPVLHFQSLVPGVQESKPTDADPTDTRGQLCFPIAYKGLEHPWILGSLGIRDGVLEPIPHEC